MSDKTAFERDQRESRGKKNKNKKKKKRTKEFLFFRHSFLKDKQRYKKKSTDQY